MCVAKALVLEYQHRRTMGCTDRAAACDVSRLSKHPGYRRKMVVQNPVAVKLVEGPYFCSLAACLRLDLQSSLS